MSARLAGLLVAGVLGLLVAPAVQAQAVNGQETVGQFRDWPELMQLGYVLGARSSLAVWGDLRCPKSRTNGEMIAALKYNASLKPTDLLSKAVFAVEMQDGCRVEAKP